MPIWKIPITIFCLLFFIQLYCDAQSLGYKILLKSLYDQELPIVYPDQSEILQKAVLLDTREIKEFEVSHLNGAQWVGYDTFTLDKIKHIPKEQPIVVYCSIGVRSQEIGAKLREAGYNEVYNLYGGIFHWVNEGKAVYNNQTKTNKVHAYSKSWGIWLNKGEKVY